MTASLVGKRAFLVASSHAKSSSIRAASTVASQQQSDSSSSRYGLFAAAGAFAAASTVLNEKDNAKCCGIAGVVGAKGDARDYLIEGLTILKNRGYDSAGIATMDENNPQLVRTYRLCFILSFMMQNLIAS